MPIFGLFTKAKEMLNKSINPEYANNKDFLEAVAAAAAFVASADGDISPDEKTTTIDQLTSHPTLGKLYSTNDIRDTADKMFNRAASSMGRMQLTRELDDIRNKPNAGQMAEDVFWVAVDVANSDGDVSEAEQKVLDKLQARLGVKIADSL